MKKSFMFTSRNGRSRRGVVVSLVGCGGGAKPKATFFWAGYDGLTEDFRASLEAAFNKESKDAQVQIVPVTVGQPPGQAQHGGGRRHTARYLGRGDPLDPGLHVHELRR